MGTLRFFFFFFRKQTVKRVLAAIPVERVELAAKIIPVKCVICTLAKVGINWGEGRGAWRWARGKDREGGGSNTGDLDEW